jgi:hypothetical protein
MAVNQKWLSSLFAIILSGPIQQTDVWLANK